MNNFRLKATTSIVTSLVALTTTVGITDAEARLVGLNIAAREPFVGGATWGTVGAYERLLGTATFEVDPLDSRNSVIFDLNKAPKNAGGKVTYTSQFMILKPLDSAKGNKKLIYGPLNNRGNSALTTAATTANVSTSASYLLRQGYTVIDIGWQGNLLPATAKLAPTFPIAKNADGSAITQRIRVPFNQRGIPAAGAFTQDLEGNGNGGSYRPYETADLNTANATLTVREGLDYPPTAISSDRWAFGKCPTGQASLVPGRSDICYFDGFKQSLLYELVYTAQNPTVLGLGYAVVRDFASFLRYEAKDDAGVANPVGPITTVLGHGSSQVGSLYRDYIYLGFNEDEKGRKVHDGVYVQIAGSLRLLGNVRFGDPNLYTEQNDIPDYLQTSFPPFTYAVTTDPISGVTDGLMKRPLTDPLVIQIDSETEFYQLHGSLNVADGLGRPLPVPDKVRLYLSNNTPHGYNTGGLTIPSSATVSVANALCVNPAPGSAVNDTVRAAYAMLDAWVSNGTLPPTSNYPRLENGTLGSISEVASKFPKIPGVSPPTKFNVLRSLNYGPEFTLTGGIQSINPPVVGKAYLEYLPMPGADGTTIAGIQPLNVRVPVGTGTGWNLQNFAGARSTDLCGLTGSFFALPKTAAERQASGDSRLSLVERYKDNDGYVAQVTAAVAKLVSEKFLIQEDADAYIVSAKAANFVPVVAPVVPEPSPVASSGGGGCTLAGPGGLFDPTLILLVLVAGGLVVVRRSEKKGQ
jgi:Alpha/beta hydrolase domain